ncbi:winged helix-turn-helix domain-containing protein [Pseudogracilibacillus sp. SE30717A]|uniref:winged helix-turn-helix domain-containing protein n=1 Tax=Pseudogracilibacillus sp. SE30717A TaxID=3098293 RepID=UPI00300E6D20
MKFSQEDYTVTLEGTEVTLLRKEFLLLKFLYKNNGRTFSRDELLDAVWPFEEPTDRTVDDHIYRLRKKLFPFRNILSIKTVKGLGYSLKIEDQTNTLSIPVPEEISRQANQLFDTYYKYGHGKAIKELVTNRALGFPIDEKQETVLLWLQSDFESLLKKLSLTENIFVPLLLYGFVESDTKKVIDVHKDILQKNILVENERMDISCCSLPIWYMKINKPDISMQLVQKEFHAIKTSDHGFIPLLHIMKTVILFYSQKMGEVEKGLDTVETVLIRFPFLREKGALKVIQGLFLIAEGEHQEGEDTIIAGIQIIHQSGHRYYFLVIYQILDLLLPKVNANKKLINHYKKEASNYFRNSKLHKLKSEIEKQVHSYL